MPYVTKAMFVKAIKKIERSKKMFGYDWIYNYAQMQILDDATAIILELCDEGSTREEITGLSTKGKNKNHGNSGFAGGCTLAAA